jgi:hypothetical protein
MSAGELFALPVQTMTKVLNYLLKVQKIDFAKVNTFLKRIPSNLTMIIVG